MANSNHFSEDLYEVTYTDDEGNECLYEGNLSWADAKSYARQLRTIVGARNVQIGAAQ